MTLDNLNISSNEDENSRAYSPLLVQYMKYISNIKRIFSSNNNWNVKTLFRGESSKHNTSNVSSILRSKLRQEKESSLYNTYMRMFPNKFLNMGSNFDKLEFMQHYGLDTRLLDVTDNPLIALYFACSKHMPSIKKGKNLPKQNNPLPKDKRDGYVYMFDELSSLDNTFSTALNSNESRVKLLSNLFFMNSSKRKAIRDSIKYNGNKKSWSYTSNELKELYKESGLSIRSDINLLNLIDKFYVINPDFNNSRIRSQSGYFIFETYFSKTFEDATVISHNIDEHIPYAIRIPYKYKREIIRELDNLADINESKVFPDYSHTADYLNNNMRHLY